MGAAPDGPFAPFSSSSFPSPPSLLPFPRPPCQIYGVFVAAIEHDDMPQVKVLGDFDPRFPNFATPAEEVYPTWSWLITQPW